MNWPRTRPSRRQPRQLEVVRNVYVRPSGSVGMSPAVEIHCDRTAVGQILVVGHVDRGDHRRLRLELGSSLRATICQCGSASPSFKPATPVLNSFIRSRLGIWRAKRARTGRPRESPPGPSASLPPEPTRSLAGELPGRPPVAAGRRTSTLPRKTCDRVVPELVHLDAELGAQVGDDGGGSPDDKFGIWDLGFGICGLLPLIADL